MDIAIKIVLILHFVGLSLLLGGALAQMTSKVKTVTRPMIDGAYTQLLTGAILMGLLQANDEEVDNVKFGVKILIAAIITALLLVNRKKQGSIPKVWGIVLLLTLANVAIAVLW